MQTFFRLTLLGTFASLGIGVAVAVALQSKSPAEKTPIAESPVVSLHTQTEVTPSPSDHAAAKTNPELAAVSSSDRQPIETGEPSPVENVAPEPLSDQQPAEPAEGNQLQTADSPRLAPYRSPVIAQIEDLEATLQRTTDAARRNEQLLNDTFTTLRQPPSEGPRIRAVPRGEPAPETTDEEPGGETIPTPPKSFDPATAEIHRNEGDDTLSLHLQNSELRGVLKMLSDQGSLNILASKSVQGSVSATLSSVDVNTALNAILQSTGYTSRREGRFVYVGTPQDFLDMDQLKDKIGTRIYRTNYVKAADLSVLITPMLTERVGKVTVSTPAEVDIVASTSKTGSDGFANEEVIMVRDYEAVLVQVDQIVEEVDRRPQQVLIEAMIITVKLDDTNTMGVDFAALLDTNTSRLFTGTPQASLAAIDVSRGGLKFGFLNGAAGNFITALETVGDTTVVASPKLMCLNKQRAEILIGQQLGYISSTVTETSTTQAVQFLEVGTQLRIRPFISRDGMVRMEVHPELSTGNVRVVGAFTLPDKVVTQVTTNIMCRDGATVVIGGLIRKDDGANINQLPLLGNLPWVGALFRRKVESTSRNEIIVVLTPRIVTEPEVNLAASQEVGDYLQRHSVFADKMSPIGKRHYARSHYRLALAAWESGNAKAALRNINISVQFDPLNLDAIRLRNEITGTPNWTYNDGPPVEGDVPPGWQPPAEYSDSTILQGKSPTPAVKPARFEAPVTPSRGNRKPTSSKR